MSRFREIYSTERFAQVLAINTAAFAAANDEEVERVTLFTVRETGRTFAQNRKGPFGAQTLEHRDVTPAEPATQDQFYLKDSYIVTHTAGGFVRIVGRIIGGDGSAGYQLAGRPYDDLAVYGYDTRARPHTRTQSRCCASVPRSSIRHSRITKAPIRGLFLVC